MEEQITGMLETSVYQRIMAEVPQKDFGVMMEETGFSSIDAFIAMRHCGVLGKTCPYRPNFCEEAYTGYQCEFIGEIDEFTNCKGCGKRIEPICEIFGEFEPLCNDCYQPKFPSGMPREKITEFWLQNWGVKNTSKDNVSKEDLSKEDLSKEDLSKEEEEQNG